MTDSAEYPARREVAVVGGGIVGLCLAEALRSRGIATWCFEQGTVGGGQSGGVTRIFRHRHDRDRLVALALRARQSWTELGRRLGERLVGDEGVLILSGEEEAARLRGLGVAAEDLSWDAARARMPLGDPNGEQPRAAFEDDGGAIRVRAAIQALERSLSGSFVSAEVRGFAQSDSGVTVFASDGIYEADEVFVTAGAGTAALAAANGVEIAERRATHLRLTFEARSSQPLPCLLDKSGSFGEVAYGSPTPDGDGYAIGISSEDGSVPTADCGAPDGEALAQIGARVEAYAKRLLPTALGPSTGARLCLSTPLPSGDDDFRAWRQGRLTFFAGHNLFKFAPLIGTLLADSAGGRELAAELQTVPGKR